MKTIQRLGGNRKITFSVIVPVYNVEDYVAVCVNSLLNQTRRLDEIIIIDDGSTDNSYEVCMELVEGKDNIQLVHQKNQGPGAARNSGIELSNGEYILFVDSDDMLREDAVEHLERSLDTTPVDILLYDAETEGGEIYGIKRNCYDRHRALGKEVVSGNEVFQKVYPRFYSPCVWLMVFRRGFLANENLRFPEGILHEDNVFFFQAITKAKVTSYLPEKFYIRRYRENSIMTSGWSESRLYGLFKGTLLIWNYIRGELEEIAQNTVFADIVALYLYDTLRRVCTNIESIIDIGYSLQSILMDFLETWLPYYNNGGDSFIKWKCCMYLIDFLDRANIKLDLCELLHKDFDTINKQYFKYIKSKLELLPFQSFGTKVGIYGKGKHTQKMLEAYRHSIGDIVCDLIYVDSYDPGSVNDELKEMPINIRDAKGQIDVLVVSSFIYQLEMNDMIDEILGIDFPRILLYGEADITSCFG